MSKPIQNALRKLKDQFLDSINEYLDNCILLEDVKKMRRFIENISNYLRDEVSRTTREEVEEKRVWHIILKDVRLTADFSVPVSLDKALEILEIGVERVEEAY